MLFYYVDTVTRAMSSIDHRFHNERVCFVRWCFCCHCCHKLTMINDIFFIVFRSVRWLRIGTKMMNKTNINGLSDTNMAVARIITNIENDKEKSGQWQRERGGKGTKSRMWKNYGLYSKLMHTAIYKETLNLFISCWNTATIFDSSRISVEL